jgi:hypothetical protein
MTPLRHIKHTNSARLTGFAFVVPFRSGLAT